jgi:hypothetical protein
MVRSDARTWLPHVAALVVALAAGLAFWWPGFARAGTWPAPLDDVYIYYGFARSTALGHVLAWTPGNGYSSGATSLLYPLVLAPFWLVGFRGPWLGLGAAVIAVLGLADLAASMTKVLGETRRVRLARKLAPLVLVSCPLLDWSLFSGMETALFAALLGRALVASNDALHATAEARAAAQWASGLWLAALPLARPESVVLSGCLAVAIVHGAGSLGTLASLGRTLTPVALTLATQVGVNRCLTGEWKAAGAIRKLLTELPDVTPSQLVIETAKNLIVLLHQAVLRGVGGAPGLAAVALLALAALVVPYRRRLAAALVSGALGMLLLVCLNATARFQNYRYATPSLLVLLATTLLGIGALGWSSTARRTLAAALAALVCLAPLPEWSKQRDHFARASRNIVAQQGEVARKLGEQSPRPRRVLVGDAGAIPYLSELPALDGLGLGGYHALPFARASLEGDAAVVELIERMPSSDRPDTMALYPNWWPVLTERFGVRLDAVRIDDNVICAADEKVIYRADFTALGRPSERAWARSVDELDVADLVSEREHEVRIAGSSGRVVDDVRMLDDGRPRWDAGRVVRRGGTLSFRIASSGARGQRLLVRTDRPPSALACPRFELRRGDALLREGCLTARADGAPGRWPTLEARLETWEDDVIVITSDDDDLRLYRIAITSDAPP